MKKNNCKTCFQEISIIKPSRELLMLLAKREYSGWLPRGDDTEVLLCKNSSCKNYSRFVPDKWWVYKHQGKVKVKSRSNIKTLKIKT